MIDYNYFEIWEKLSPNNKYDIITHSIYLNYYDYWDIFERVYKEMILKHKEIDFDKYNAIITEKWEFDLLYSFNNETLNKISFLVLSTSIQKNIIKSKNKLFDYTKDWERLSFIIRERIIKTYDFDYEVYWDKLSQNERIAVIQFCPDFNVDKYITELTIDEILYIQLEKITKKNVCYFVDAILTNPIQIKNYIFNDQNYTNELRLTHNNSFYSFYPFKIVDNIPQIKKLLIKLFNKIGYINIKSLSEIFEENLIKYPFAIDNIIIRSDKLYIFKYDGKYFLPLLNIYIEDYSLILRKKKLKTLL